MKEIIYYIIPVVLVFCLIGLIESAMIFEKAQEENLVVPSKKIERKDKNGDIKSRWFM